MPTQTLEERVAVLEAEMVSLEAKEQDKAAEELRGWKRIVGIFADNPEFEEAVRAGKEWRDSFRPPDYEEAFCL